MKWKGVEAQPNEGFGRSYLHHTRQVLHRSPAIRDQANFKVWVPINVTRVHKRMSILPLGIQFEVSNLTNNKVSLMVEIRSLQGETQGGCIGNVLAASGRTQNRGMTVDATKSQSGYFAHS
jgi:hypothetical protein